MDDRRPGPEPGGARSHDHVGERASDAEIRAVAEQLVRERGETPAPSPGDQVSGSAHELAPADEERVEAALVALGAVDPENTMRAEREAAGEPEPRPAPASVLNAARGGPPARA